MDKYRYFIAVLWITLPGLMLPPAAGQTPQNPDQASLPPGVATHIEAAPKTGTVGDPIQIDLDIAMPSGYQLKVPPPESHVGDFVILDFKPGSTVPGVEKAPSDSQSSSKQTGKRLHHRTRILVAVYKTGKFTFPSMQIKLKTAEGKAITILSPPVDIEIQSVLKGKNQDLKDLKKQAEIPVPFPWILWSSIALALIVIAVIAWFLWRRHRRRPLSFSPEQTQDLLELAEADLRDLLGRGLPDSGMEKQFYILLSEIVKRILEPGFEIHTAERTTSEIMDSLNRKPSIETNTLEKIESFLLRCDIVKFAKYIPSRTEQEVATQDAVQILEEAKKAAGIRQSPVVIAGS